MEKKTIEEKETEFIGLLKEAPYPVEHMLELIDGVSSGKADEWTALLMQALIEAEDFRGAICVAKARGEEIAKRVKGGTTEIRDFLKKTTKDRLQLAIVDSVGFGVRSFKESMARLERLLSYVPGTPAAFVLNSTWGLGEIVRLDYFYRRVTVDFRTRKGHQMTFDAACEMLTPAPENHILMRQKKDPDEVEKWIKETPGVFIKEMLKSYGDMPLTRIEDLCIQNGFVKQANWKAFWEQARLALKADKLVEIPTRRSEPLHLKATVETYGATWFTAFSAMKDPKCILSSIKELEGTERFKKTPLTEEERAKISERLAFALKGTRGVNDALYARLAFAVSELKLAEPPCDRMRKYLLEFDRYLKASQELPARDMDALVAFLTAENREESKHLLFAKLAEMNFALLSATLNFFKSDADCEDAVVKLLALPKAPATLVTYILERYDDFKGWKKLPPFIRILEHAIALGEGRQNGETLKMQNVVRRLFADQGWMDGVFKRLTLEERVQLFERFQASTAWDPSTHHVIVVRMTRLAPELVPYLARKEVKKEVPRVTSQRSYAERQAAYKKLVEVDMPENTKRIEFARSYGDLSENAEYQYAKDEQRALLQKQSVMQEELDVVKPVDFSDAEANEVWLGTTVVATVADGERTFTILGEWDNDLSRNILSCKTKLAENMLGKKVGDTFEISDAEGNVQMATISAVLPLSDELKAWIKGA